MSKSAPGSGDQPGSLYRDLDGKLVCLVKVKENLCTWIPVSEAGKTRQVTHRDNFRRRFTLVGKNPARTTPGSI